MEARGYATHDSSVLTGSDLVRVANEPEQLNGAFGISDEHLAVTDRLGSRPIYLDSAGRASFDFWDLSQGSEMNPAAAVEMLTYGYALGEHTLAKSVVEAPAASISEWRDGSWSSRRYWSYRPSASRVTANEFADVLEGMSTRAAAVCSAIGLDRPGVNLTAGRDSRLVAAILRHGGVDTRGYFTTMDVAGEEIVAARLANALGSEHTAVRMWWRDGREDPPGDVLRTVGPTTMFTVSNHPMNLVAAGPFPVQGFISGHLGDVLSGDHISLRDRQVASNGTAAIAHHLAESRAIASAEALEALLLPEHRGLPQQAREHFRGLAAEIDVEHPAHVATVIDLEQRQRRFILRDYNALLTLGPSMAPLADHAFADFFERVPLRWQLGSPLYTSGMHEFLRRHGPEELRREPVNGYRLHRVRVPEVKLVKDNLAARVKNRISRSSQSAGRPQAEKPGEWLEDVGWLCDPVAVRELWSSLSVNVRRSLETVGRVSRLMDGGVPLDGERGSE